ncbi:RNA polymerase sigma factor [Cupriavidus sp. 30B13]|uniref:RNA polymerase sigma factor n=1 Tax=Cupriavidus sp. 30B13 TaxID=3384241 RepID=UPI003B8EEAB4
MRATPPAPGATWLGLNLDWIYTDLLRGIVRRTCSVHHARDVLHDALVRFAVVTLRSRIAEPQAYVRRIVESVLVDHYRSDSRYVPLAEGDEPQPGQADIGAEAAPSSETLADLRQRLAAIQAVIESLPPRCREVFWLLRVEGFTYAEIGARMGIAQKTVEGHAVRALVQLSLLRERLA